MPIVGLLVRMHTQITARRLSYGDDLVGGH
jgi:hypothetical protein